jgi:hypothetical protein
VAAAAARASSGPILQRLGYGRVDRAACRLRLAAVDEQEDVSMNTAMLLAVALVVVAAALLVWWFVSRKRRSDDLRERFGPEYDREVEQRGARDDAERTLEARAERVEKLNIRALSTQESARYADDWRAVQAHFVDDPDLAIAEADGLVAEVMQNMGYPMGDFEQRAADVSVDHARVVDNYRTAHAIARRSAKREAATEELRQAMVHYRTLFDDLIGAREPVTQEAHR